MLTRHLELAERHVAEGDQLIARQREIIAEHERLHRESVTLQTARELLQEMARYWQMRSEEIRTLAGSIQEVEAKEIMLRIADDYE